ncbi:hypothetical protein M3Y97_00230200 [Aphelenchoides bicaudatus]|nr:hypothetical protein M3Y97_00230200 [Aphelenchoides bicaudatus]
MGGNKRSSAFITNSSPIMPTYQEEPIYSEISVVQMARGSSGSRLEPLQTAENRFLPVVPPNYHDQQTPKMLGQKAARFNLSRLEVLSCTDGFFGFLFVLFLIGWGLVAFVALSYGKPDRVIYPTDSEGNAKKPFLFYFDLLKCVSYNTILNDCGTRKICVEKCPSAYFSYISLATMNQEEFRRNVQNAYCHYSIDVNAISNFTELQDLVNRKLCAVYTVPSAVILGRCVPGKLVDASNSLTGKTGLDEIVRRIGNDKNLIPSDGEFNASKGIVDKIARADSTAILQKVAYDISASWRQILAIIAFGAVVSFLWIIVMRIFGGFMIWVSILLLIGGLGFGTYYCFTRYQSLVKAGAINDYSFQPMLSVYLEMPNTWLAFSIVLGVCLVIFLLVMIVIRSRVRLAVALIAETSKALGHMMSTLFFPIFPFVLYLVVFSIWGIISVYLSSLGTENCQYVSDVSDGSVQDPNNGRPCDCSKIAPTDSDNPYTTTCRFINLTKPESQIAALQAYNLFACFWVSCFVSGLSAMTISGAFASYYFAYRKPKDVPAFPVFRSLARYHLGTIALGSLILAIVKFFKVILDFVYNKLKGVENPVGKAIYRALSCLFWCLEKILRYLTKNAYIMTAIYGQSFCKASRDSFGLLMRNLIRVVVLNRVTGFLLFVGKALIVVGNGAIAFYYFSGKWVVDGIPQVNLHYYFVPIIVVVIGTYFIADLFFDVYDMGVDSIFLCFLEDCENNDGSDVKPYYMSKNLKKILGKD